MCIPLYMLYVHIVCKIFCACVIASVCVPVFVPSTTLHVFVCTPSQMVTLCLFWCPVNTRTLDDCRFSFPWVQVSVSQTTEYCLYCGLLPCTHSSALCLGHALGEPFYTLFYRTVTSCIENCVFRRDYSRGRCHGHARLCFQSALFQPGFTGAKNLYASALTSERLSCSLLPSAACCPPPLVSEPHLALLCLARYDVLLCLVRRDTFLSSRPVWTGASHLRLRFFDAISGRSF